MYFVTFLMSLALWTTSVDAVRYDFGPDVGQFVKRQSQPDGPVLVGRLPLTANGTLPLRQEVRQMSNDTYQWNLFVLALSMMQDLDEDDRLSWYQLAGIHGVPFEPWDGVEATPGGNQSGYCKHSSVLFPIWHRPYVALMEQQTYILVNEIATMFTDPDERTFYQAAAAQFRWPYWDWAMKAPEGESQLPKVFWQSQIDQYGPQGTQTIENPLYSYIFHPLQPSDMVYQPFVWWQETSRAPEESYENVESPIDPPSRNDVVDAVMGEYLTYIQNRLFNMLSSNHNWNMFSTKAWDSQNNATQDSIEALHDFVHEIAGYGGDMSFIPVSSFDPLFFMHHAMVDRVLTMWQILNPSAWIQPMQNSEASFNSPVGSIENSSTPLTPFRISEDGTFWDSDMSRLVESFGYNYADTYTNSSNSTELQNKVRARIVQLYGSSMPSSSHNEQRRGDSAAKRQATNTTTPRNSIKGLWRPNLSDNAPEPPNSMVMRDGSWTEWQVSVRANAASLDMPFTFQLFIGSLPEVEPQHLLRNHTQNYVGSADFVSMFHDESKVAPVISTVLPLTASLRKLAGAGYLSKLEPNEVVPFLKDFLRFQVVAFNDSTVDPTNIDNLVIQVVSSKVKAPASKGMLPTWGPQIPRISLWPVGRR